MASFARACLAVALLAAPVDAWASPPSSAFLDLVTGVLGASMDGDYIAASKAVGALLSRCADRVPCVAEGDGVRLDFGSSRYTVSLLARAGYLPSPTPVAEEDPKGMRIVGAGAYLFAVDRQKLRYYQDYLAMCYGGAR